MTSFAEATRNFIGSGKTVEPIKSHVTLFFPHWASLEERSVLVGTSRRSYVLALFLAPVDCTKCIMYNVLFLILGTV